MFLPVDHGCRGCFQINWRIEFSRRVRKFSFSALPPAAALLLRPCPPGLTLKMKSTAYRIWKGAASRSQSIVMDLRLIPTAEIELLPQRDSQRCAAVWPGAYRN